jgi:hypothetical protein
LDKARTPDVIIYLAATRRFHRPERALWRVVISLALEAHHLRDLYFFSGAALLSVTIISAAFAFDPRTVPNSPMSVGSGPRDIVTVSGIDLYRFRETRRDTATVIRPENQPPFLRLTSRRNSDLPTNVKDVAHLPLATDLELAFAERRLTITVIARAAHSNGSPIMRAMYAADAGQSSNWQTFLLAPEWQRYTFEITPPPSPNNRSLDFLAIWADPDGLGRGAEIQSISLDVRGN